MRLCISNKPVKTLALAAAVSLVAACGGGRGEGSAAAAAATAATSATPIVDASPSAGQVKPVAVTKMSSYAAARATDQVSFGATPALVAELQQQGLPAWIEGQLALPVSEITPPPWVIDFDVNNSDGQTRANNFNVEEFWRRALVAPDQLRHRLAWSLFEFIPVSMGQAYMRLDHQNLLLRKAFGNYGDFLRELSIHPSMGWYLNNNINRPTTTQCPQCTPNENFARELMQLFTLGVVQLNGDGSTVRDAQGKAKETYTQKDVEEMARALTGWRIAPSLTPLPGSNFTNAGKLMVPETQASQHDRGAKTILGTAFVAGNDAYQDLDAAIAVLMKHPNIAPFVSLRLIQHLVTSNPTPQYIARVAAVFRNNGQGVAGDMKALIRAVLLDAEARRGDQPGADPSSFGKLREPVLWLAAAQRGLGCKESLHETGGNVALQGNQNPTSPPSIFSFYQAGDRAPGSNLLAPEQKLLTTDELTKRLGMLAHLLLDANKPITNTTQSGCDVATLGLAFSKSPKDLIDLISARWFRGAMPPTLRSNLLSLAVSQTWESPDRAALVLLQFALSTPYFGVIK